MQRNNEEEKSVNEKPGLRKKCNTKSWWKDQQNWLINLHLHWWRKKEQDKNDQHWEWIQGVIKKTTVNV